MKHWSSIGKKIKALAEKHRIDFKEHYQNRSQDDAIDDAYISGYRKALAEICSKYWIPELEFHEDPE